MVTTSQNGNDDDLESVKIKRITDLSGKNKPERKRKNSTGRKESAADARWKFACMEENDQLRRIYEERPYQVEIVEKALSNNTVVCFCTGTGKTFISSSVIKEMQGGIVGTQRTNGKRTIVLVDSVSMVYEQVQVITSMTSLKVGFYTGDMLVEFWDKQKWLKEFDNHDVLVMTSQILVMILNQSFITVKDINLLIFDDCQNAADINHPYSQIMHVVNSYSREEQPHILGLTTSIIDEHFRKKVTEMDNIQVFLSNHIETLRKTMISKCITCSDRKSYEKRMNKPVEVIKTYQSNRPFGDNLKDIFEMGDVKGEIVQGLLNASKRFRNIQNTTEVIVSRLAKAIIAEVEWIENENDVSNMNQHSNYNEDTRCDNILSIVSDAAEYCAHVLCELGPWCGYEASKIILKQLSKHKGRNLDTKDVDYLDECINLLNEVKTCFENLVENTECKKVRDIKLVEPFISRKSYVFLNDILLEEKKTFQSEDEGFRAIVLVKRKCTAVILDKMINWKARNEKEIFDGIKSRFDLGQGLSTNIKSADSNMKSVDRSKVIKEFKSDVFNILVATYDAEESLDLKQCHLVVCFDRMENYKQYMRSKSHACSLNSKFVMMVSEEKEKEAVFDLKINQEIESHLNEMYLKERGLPNIDGIGKLLESKEEERVPTYFAHDGPDAAQINHGTAVALIHRYCSMLPRDLYSSTCPHFEYSSRNNESEFQATLFLPMNFPLVQKVYQSLWFSDKSVCKKWVSLHVCIALHVARELDDNLLPVRHTKEDSDFEEDRDEMKPKEGTRKSQDYYHRKFPDAISRAVFTFDTCELFVLSISLVEPRDRPSSIALRPFWFEEERKGFGILLPSGMPKNLPPIKMYTRAGGILVSLIYLQNDNSVIENENALKFHCSMMDICAGKHISGKYLFDINDERVSKGLLVPLKPSAFNAIESVKSGVGFDATKCDNFIDLNGINRYVEELADIGRDEDEGFTNAIINKTYLNEQQNRRLYYIAGLSDQQGKDVMEGETTYSSYYLNKYNHILGDETYLLEAVPCPSRVNFSEDLAKKDCTKQSTYKPERLVPDLCKKAFRTHVHLHQQLNLLPYILYMFESVLNAYELRGRISKRLKISHEVDEEQKLIKNLYEMTLTDSPEQLLANMLRQSIFIDKSMKSPSIMEVLETLTTRQAKFPYDLERLEMLGDSFLKQAVSVFLFFKHPKAHEGTLSSKRKRCISNKNLCRIAKSKEVGIQHIICNSQFGNVNPGNENQNSLTVWLPPGCYRTEEKGESIDYIDDDVKIIVDELVQTVVDNEYRNRNPDSIFDELKLSKIFEDLQNSGKGSNDFNSSIDSRMDLEDTSFFKSEEERPTSNFIETDHSLQMNSETSNYQEIEVKTDLMTNELSGNSTEPEDSHDSAKEEIPINISKDLPYQLVQDKSLADCVEALIGLYFKIGGTNLALHFMQEFLSIDVLFDAISDKEICKVRTNSPSKYADFPCLHSAIQNPECTYKDVEAFYEEMKLNRLESILGYEFKDKSFLVQAMTHLSYQRNNITGCYQQLEFLGDAILDFLVTLHIYMYKPDLSPGDLTSLRSALVNNNTFGLLVVKFEWHKFLKHFSPKLHNVCQEFLSVVNETPSALEACFENPFVIVRENSEEGFHAPKVLGDIFESIAGAVFLDSHLDLVGTWKIFYPFMKEIIDKYMEKIPLNPIREFHEKYTTGSLSYEPIDEETVVCTATYGNGKTKTGIGKNKRIAKATVCHKAVYG